LFAAGEPGVWYDPSDLSTLFQDVAGTIPVTDPGNTVGLMLDKSKGGQQTLPTTGWAQTSGDGVVTVVDNVITITGATTTTRVDVASPGWQIGDYARITVNASIGSAVGPLLFVGGAAAYSTSAGAATYSAVITASTLLRLQVTSGSATFTVTARSRTPGNHATQATAASRPIYGVVPQGGRRNLVIVSEPTKAQLTATTSGVTDAAAFGTFARSIQFPVGANTEYTYLAGDTGWVSGVTATVSVYVRMDDGLAPVFGSAVTTNIANDFAITARGSLIAPDTYTITDLGGGIYRVSATGTTGANASNSGVVRFATNSGRGFRVTGYTLELGSTATNYQRVTTQYDVTEAGVQSLSYLAFDGVDDFMVTDTITPGTDKVTVAAGVRKLSDAARGIVAELSAGTGTNGTFNLNAPNSGAPNYAFRCFGTVQSDAVSASSFAAPITNVLTGLGDISGDSSTLRINGAQAAQSTTDLGTGNFLANAMYIGRRNGATLPFNGQIYSLVTRFAATDLATVAQLEAWINGKTGAYS